MLENPCQSFFTQGFNNNMSATQNYGHDQTLNNPFNVSSNVSMLDNTVMSGQREQLNEAIKYLRGKINP